MQFQRIPKLGRFVLCILVSIQKQLRFPAAIKAAEVFSGSIPLKHPMCYHFNAAISDFQSFYFPTSKNIGFNMITTSSINLFPCVVSF